MCCGKSKLVQIAQGHMNVLLKKNLELAGKRLSVCNSCDMNKKGWCKACGCYLQAAVTVPEKECIHPEGSKWKDL